MMILETSYYTQGNEDISEEKYFAALPLLHSTLNKKMCNIICGNCCNHVEQLLVNSLLKKDLFTLILFLLIILLLVIILLVWVEKEKKEES